MRFPIQRLAGVCGLFAASIATAAQAGTGYGDGWHHGSMGWGGWLHGSISMIIFFALLIGAVVIIARLLGPDRHGGGASSSDRALEILRERFARGEISSEEYEAARKTLERSS